MMLDWKVNVSYSKWETADLDLEVELEEKNPHSIACVWVLCNSLMITSFLFSVLMMKQGISFLWRGFFAK